MAIYRTISQSFWTDIKVVDDFTPEDKFFYLYLLTNPHTNLCGCYEFSIKTAADETGYSKETIEKLLHRFESVHKIIKYEPTTKEILLFNWHKFNWNKSPNTILAIEKLLSYVKSAEFRNVLMELIDKYKNGDDTPCIGYAYPIEPSVSVSDTVSDSVSVSNSVSDTNKKKSKKDIKHKYGSYNNVLLTDKEYDSLVEKYGVDKTNDAIKYLDEYVEMKGAKYKSHYLALLKWVFDAVEKNKSSTNTGNAYIDAINNRVNIVDTW